MSAEVLFGPATFATLRGTVGALIFAFAMVVLVGSTGYAATDDSPSVTPTGTSDLPSEPATETTSPSESPSEPEKVPTFLKGKIKVVQGQSSVQVSIPPEYEITEDFDVDANVEKIGDSSKTLVVKRVRNHAKSASAVIVLNRKAGKGVTISYTATGILSPTETTGTTKGLLETLPSGLTRKLVKTIIWGLGLIGVGALLVLMWGYRQTVKAYGAAPSTHGHDLGPELASFLKSTALLAVVALALLATLVITKDAALTAVFTLLGTIAGYLATVRVTSGGEGGGGNQNDEQNLGLDADQLQELINDPSREAVVLRVPGLGSATRRFTNSM